MEELERMRWEDERSLFLRQIRRSDDIAVHLRKKLDSTKQLLISQKRALDESKKTILDLKKTPKITTCRDCTTKEKNSLKVCLETNKKFLLNNSSRVIVGKIYEDYLVNKSGEGELQKDDYDEEGEEENFSLGDFPSFNLNIPLENIRKEKEDEYSEVDCYDESERNNHLLSDDKKTSRKSKKKIQWKECSDGVFIAIDLNENLTTEQQKELKSLNCTKESLKSKRCQMNSALNSQSPIKNDKNIIIKSTYFSSQDKSFQMKQSDNLIQEESKQQENIPLELDNKPRQQKNYKTVVRSKAMRELMPGHDCLHCAKFYKAIDGVSGDGYSHVKKCSRHRAFSSPCLTPDGFWDLNFPDSP